MFLRHLNVLQKRNLLIMAFTMMTADGVVRDAEKCMLEALKHETGIGGIPREEYEAGPDLALFNDRRSQMAALMKLASIAYSDREFHATEIKVLVGYGHAFQVSAEDMKALHSWGRRHQELVAEAESLIDTVS